jgi:threonine dehydrogenase-like Zn-dependent dehydrogenase
MFLKRNTLGHEFNGTVKVLEAVSRQLKGGSPSIIVCAVVCVMPAAWG